MSKIVSSIMDFVIYGHSSSETALACGSCNFESLENITRAHISRNAQAFIQFSLHKHTLAVVSLSPLSASLSNRQIGVVYERY